MPMMACEQCWDDICAYVSSHLLFLKKYLLKEIIDPISDLYLKQLRILKSINLRLPLIFGSEDFAPTASSSTESSGEVVNGSSEDAVVDVV